MSTKWEKKLASASITLADLYSRQNSLDTTMTRDVVCGGSEDTQELAGGAVEIHPGAVLLLERSNHDRHDAVDGLECGQYRRALEVTAAYSPFGPP